MTPQGFLGYDKSDTIVPHNTKCLSVTETSVAIVTTSWDYSHLKTMLLLTRIKFIVPLQTFPTPGTS